MAGGILTSFIDAAMKEVKIEQLDNGRFYAEIPSCPGVWANGETEDECIIVLREVLEE
ncbi:MAG: type II toxin-antitoxin system HicB family antitoxin [Bacillota bacterium]